MSPPCACNGEADTIEAIEILARYEGILLDPVYSGKCMAGLIDLCRKGLSGKSRTLWSFTQAVRLPCSVTSPIFNDRKPVPQP